ncbi:MAG: sugar transferase, partial [Candidatus Omnitrophica bacterium]|nr:sugar transferase [Candidatus Omnitrophota bacterium]
MLKKYARIFSSLLIVTDACLICTAFLMAYWACRYFNGLTLGHDPFGQEYVLAFIAWVMLGEWSLYTAGVYDSFRFKQGRTVLLNVMKGMVLTFLGLAVILYVFKVQHVSRLLIMFLFVFSVLLLMMVKSGIILFMRHLRRRGLNFRNIILVGTGRRAQKFMRYLHQQTQLGLNVIGVIDEDPARIGTVVQGHTVIGTLDQMPQILHRQVVDFAVFIVPRNSLSKIEPAVKHCETVGVTTSIAVDLFDFKLRMKQDNEMMCGMPMMVYEPTPDDMSALIVKRILDIALSTAALLLISPLYLTVAAFIKWTSPGPVHFVQERCGLKGRKFKLYKFRTMVVDAEARLKDLLALNEMQGPAFKIGNDPRITKVGKFLRKYSIDELPQLWNVLHGDMSLVGPRPPLPKEVQQYDLWHQRRLSIRPGITCTWQAGGRNRISNFDQWVNMDLEYIDNWSLFLDLKILFKTIPAVLS